MKTTTMRPSTPNSGPESSIVEQRKGHFVVQGLDTDHILKCVVVVVNHKADVRVCRHSLNRLFNKQSTTPKSSPSTYLPRPFLRNNHLLQIENTQNVTQKKFEFTVNVYSIVYWVILGYKYSQFPPWSSACKNRVKCILTEFACITTYSNSTCFSHNLWICIVARRFTWWVLGDACKMLYILDTKFLSSFPTQKQHYVVSI